MTQPPNTLRLFLIFFILSALYVFSMFYRVSNAVIAPNLIRDLGLDAESLGILGGAYFYSFALLQIPLGPMLDRIGPRRVVTFLSLIGGLGSFLFAAGHSFTIALVGRILIGAGMACVLMGSLKVFTLWFPPERFATLTGINLSIGTLGNVLAASPLAYLASTIGWRMTFVIAGSLTVVLSFLVFWVLGEDKEKGPNPPSSFRSDPAAGVLHSMRQILGSLAFWQMGTLSFFRYGTYVGLHGLWLGPYLMDVEGYSPIQTGNLLALLALGTIVGAPIGGRLSDRTFHSRKGVALVGTSLYGLTLVPLTGLIRIEGSFWYALLFFVLGFFNSFGMVVYSHARALFPAALSGTVMTGVNFFTMAGAALFMPALGGIIQSYPRVGSVYPAEAYHLCFLLCFLGMVASLVFYAFSKKEE